jgi:hypothetical protein
MKERLDGEAAIAAKFGSGLWGYFRGAMHEFSKKGMRNRVALVFCAFALQNLSGAAGMSAIHVRGANTNNLPAINYYSPTLFGSLGVTDVALYTGIYGLVKGKFACKFSRLRH